MELSQSVPHSVPAFFGFFLTLCPVKGCERYVESLSIRYGNLGGLRKMPFLAVYCLHVPYFLDYDGHSQKKGFPLCYLQIHPLPPCTMTHLMTLWFWELAQWFKIPMPHFPPSTPPGLRVRRLQRYY